MQRTGKMLIKGTPTAAAYHADDPNPGMLDAAVRATVLKTDGRAPNSNGCFGDSGGPIFVNKYGAAVRILPDLAPSNYRHTYV